MKLKYDSPEVKDLVTILLDGKPITLNMCHAADDKEGWVESYVPVGVADANEGAVEGSGHGHKLVRREGKVEFVFRE